MARHCQRSLVAALALVCGIGATTAEAAARLTIVNGNGPGVGFNDPTPAAPVGGNPGTTRGQQALNVFTRAAEIWGAALDSPVEILVYATFEPLSCTATSGVLGSAGTLFIFSDFGSVGAFPGPVLPGTWHGSALADKRAGADVNPEPHPSFPQSPATPDIRTRFNSALGTPGCLEGGGWYFGLDNAEPPGMFDLLAVVLHEIGHGLGFQQFASVTTGAQPLNLPDVYNVNLLDRSTNKRWPEMTNAERAASAINSRRLTWDGPTVHAAAPEVLQAGTPILRVHAPAAIAGFYSVGTAAFGPALDAAGLSGDVVLGVDDANAAGPSTTDACSPLTNAAAVAGRVALVDRGTCAFVIKVKNAQNAGAVAVIVADNVAGGPPAGLGGADPTITVPSVRITLADGNTIKAQLASTVNVTLGLDLTLLAGADETGRVHMNAPNPVQPGSSVSHYDPLTLPNQLMEPSINSDLTSSVQPPRDLTLPLMRDVGWFPDVDNDGFGDTSDACTSSSLGGTVVVEASDTGVGNLLLSTGCTLQDLVNGASSGNHGDYVSSITHLVNALRDQGIITNEERKAIHGAAARSDVGKK